MSSYPSLNSSSLRSIPALACRRVTAPKTTTHLFRWAGASYGGLHPTTSSTLRRGVGRHPLLSGASLVSTGDASGSDSQLPECGLSLLVRAWASTQRIVPRRGLRVNGRPLPGGAHVDHPMVSQLSSTSEEGTVNAVPSTVPPLFRSSQIAIATLTDWRRHRGGVRPSIVTIAAGKAAEISGEAA